MLEEDLPETGCEVVLVTKPPTFILKARWNGEVFEVKDHWALKTLRPFEIDRWDYIGQGS